MDVLSERVAQAFHREVKYAKDCEELAAEIVQFTNRPISSATIRRVFGLLKTNSKLSRFNEETLLSYVELKNNQKGNNLANKSARRVSQIQSEVLRLVEIYDGLNQSFLTNLINSNHSPDKFYQYLNQAIIIAIEQKNIGFFIQLYRQNDIILSNPKVFRFLGSELKTNPSFASELLPELAQERKARSYFFQLFVDIGDFPIYKDWLNIYLQKEPAFIDKLWACSILIWGDLLTHLNTKRWDQFVELYELSSEKIIASHPYLKARIFGIGTRHKSLSAQFEKMILQELEKDLEDLMLDATAIPLFSVMICQYLLVFKADKTLVSLLHRILSTYNSRQTWIQDKAFPFYTKCCALYLDGGTLPLIQIIEFDSGHTNEDVPLKLFSLHYTEKTKAAEDFKNTLIKKSGFKQSVNF